MDPRVGDLPVRSSAMQNGLAFVRAGAWWRVASSSRGKTPEPRLSLRLQTAGRCGLVLADQAPRCAPRVGSPASIPQPPGCDFLPLPDHPMGQAPSVRAFLAETRNSRPAVLRVAAGLGLRAGHRGAVDRHQAAMGADLRRRQEVTVAQIGSFTRGDDGILSGAIRPSLDVKARFVPAEASSNEKARPCGYSPAPSRWARLEAYVQGQQRISLGEARRPVLPGPDLANLVEVESGYALVWSR